MKRSRVHLLIYCFLLNAFGVFSGYFYPPPSVPLPLPLPSLPPPSTTTFLPEIIINKNAAPGDGYVYPVASSDDLPPMHVVAMSCLEAQHGFFRATIKSTITPVIIGSSSSSSSTDCITVDKDKTLSIVNVEGINVAACGVHHCVEDKKAMCLTLRLPTIHGLHLPEDRVVRLRCTPQNAIAHVVRTLSFRPQNNYPQARTTGGLTASISGGAQRPLEPHVAIYRRAFPDQPLPNGGAVILGEELLLRIGVSSTEGWQYGRMGAVVFQHSNSPHHQQIALIDDDGCVAPGMRTICPNAPQQLSERDAALVFRAFAFNNDDVGVDVVNGGMLQLTVRVIACVHHADCRQQTRHCEEKVVGAQRGKRAAGNNSIADYESHLAFRVIASDNNHSPFAYTSQKIYLLLAGMLALTVLNVALRIRYYRNNK